MVRRLLRCRMRRLRTSERLSSKLILWRKSSMLTSHYNRGQTIPDRPHIFRPDYLSFAGTYQCNLTCPHCCVPIEWTDRLPITTAVCFLEEAHAAGIGVLGFTGGEPFLYPEFLVAVTRRAAELGFRFDKLMTNGVWYTDEPHLVGMLSD